MEERVQSELRKCYGAFSSLQQQMHHINGCVEEISSYQQIIQSAFNDMKNTITELLEAMKQALGDEK